MLILEHLTSWYSECQSKSLAQISAETMVSWLILPPGCKLLKCHTILAAFLMGCYLYLKEMPGELFSRYTWCYVLGQWPVWVGLSRDNNTHQIFSVVFHSFPVPEGFSRKNPGGVNKQNSLKLPNAMWIECVTIQKFTNKRWKQNFINAHGITMQNCIVATGVIQSAGQTHELQYNDGQYGHEYRPQITNFKSWLGVGSL